MRNRHKTIDRCGDLLSGSIEYINKHFLEYMQSDNNTKTFFTELQIWYSMYCFRFWNATEYRKKKTDRR